MGNRTTKRYFPWATPVSLMPLARPDVHLVLYIPGLLGITSPKKRPWATLSDFASGFFLRVLHSCGMGKGGKLTFLFLSLALRRTLRKPFLRSTVSSTPLFSSLCKIFRTNEVD